jgi:hypothetical protein
MISLESRRQEASLVCGNAMFGRGVAPDFSAAASPILQGCSFFLRFRADTP